MTTKAPALAERSGPPSPAGPLHVLHLVGQLTTGGCEYQIMNMLRHMPAEAGRHTVASFWDQGDPAIVRGIEDAGCELVWLGKRKNLDWPFMKRLTRLMRDSRADVVHCWLMSAGLWGRLAAMRPGRPPLVVSFRAEEVHHWPGGEHLDRFLMRATDLVVVNARRIQSVWARRLRIPESEIQVILNGVDAERLGPAPDGGAATRSHLGLPEGSLVVTKVGLMKPAKNWPMFLAVAGEVVKKCPRAIFLAVGGGGMLEEMKALAASMKLPDGAVRFLGGRSDVPEILSATDVSLSTSEGEGLSNAILEAMAVGLPVVATGVSGSEDLVAEGTSGFLVPSADAPAASRRVLQLLGDEALRRRMGQAGREIVLRDYSFARMADQHMQAYRRAIELHKNETGGVEPVPDEYRGYRARD